MHLMKTMTAAAAALAMTAVPVAAQYQPNRGENVTDEYRWQAQSDWDQQRNQQRGQQQDQRDQQMNRQDRSQRQSRQMSQQQRGQQSQQQATRRVNGEITSYRTAQLRGQNEPHVLAKIELDSGKTMVADLGPVSNLRNQNAQLRRGQQLQGAGKAGRINDLPIIVLDSYVGDGQFVVIAPETRMQNRQQGADQQRQQRSMQRQMMQQQDRQQQMSPQQQFAQQRMQQQRMQAMQDRMRQQAQGQAQNQGQSQQYAFPRQGMDQASQQQIALLVQGTIQDLRQVELEDQQQTHRVADIQTRGGRTVMVDLGTGEELQDVKLKTNEWVMVLGSPGEINGEPAVIAEALADIVTFERQNNQAQQQNKQKQQSQQDKQNQSSDQAQQKQQRQSSQQQKQQSNQQD